MYRFRNLITIHRIASASYRGGNVSCQNVPVYNQLISATQLPVSCGPFMSRSIFGRSKGNPESADSKTNNSQNEGAEGQPQEGAEVNAETVNKLKEELAKAVADATASKTKAKEFEDKYLLALADMENLRQRLTKQINDGKLYAIQGFCKDLTDIEDILQLAISSVPKDQITGSNKTLKELYEGIYSSVIKSYAFASILICLQVFKSHGLTQVNPMNAKFNPNEHEAVLQKEEPGIEAGTVIFVSKLGYKLHDRVIRPAVVGVSK